MKFRVPLGLLCIMSSLFARHSLEVTHSAIRSLPWELQVIRSRTIKFTAADLLTWPIATDPATLPVYLGLLKRAQA